MENPRRNSPVISRASPSTRERIDRPRRPKPTTPSAYDLRQFARRRHASAPPYGRVAPEFHIGTNSAPEQRRRLVSFGLWADAKHTHRARKVLHGNAGGPKPWFRRPRPSARAP